MGAWGADSFENDMALNWIDVFCSASNKHEFLVSMLETVTDAGDGYIDADDCSSCLAASEIVAFLNNKPNPKLPDAAKNCLTATDIKFNVTLVKLAAQAVARVKADSELKELWDESENPNEWYQAMVNLESRLQM